MHGKSVLETKTWSGLVGDDRCVALKVAGISKSPTILPVQIDKFVSAASFTISFPPRFWPICVPCPGAVDDEAYSTWPLKSVKGYGQSAFPVRGRQVVSIRCYSSCSPYACLLSIKHNCWTRLASGNAQHLSQPVPLHHCNALKHRSSTY